MKIRMTAIHSESIQEFLTNNPYLEHSIEKARYQRADGSWHEYFASAIVEFPDSLNSFFRLVEPLGRFSVNGVDNDWGADNDWGIHFENDYD